MKILFEASSGKEYLKLYNDDNGNTISVYKNLDNGKLYAKGDIPGESFHGPWTKELEDYYLGVRGFKEESTLTEGNSVSNKLPFSVDSFLQDIAQMTQVISYKDIINHEYSEEDIKKLTNLRRTANRWAAEMDDEEFEQYINDCIAPKVAAILESDKLVNESL